MATLETPLLDEGGVARKAKTRKDAKLLGRAIRERWPIPEAKKPEIVKRLAVVVARKGPEADPCAVAAARVLAMMEAQNQADDHLHDKNSRLDEGKPTERIAGVVIPPPPMPPA